MKKVTVTDVTENTEPKFLKTSLVTYEREGEKERLWEMVHTNDSVHILVANTETKELLFVKQVRIPVLLRDPATEGVMLECCAGIVDKELPLVEIAKEEVLEELGYKVKAENIEEILAYKASVGSSGNNCTAFYATVTEEDKVSEGGGLSSEDIEVVRIPYTDIDTITTKYTVDATLLALVATWYIETKQGEIDVIQ